MAAQKAARGEPSAALGAYRDAIYDWTNDLLRPYLNWLRGPGSYKRSTKQFNDPVWGTIVLQAHEIVVLDSPLLQRLRRVRQLGVVHLVYPGANHTRFEHSLGVCHQVSRLAHSINGVEIESDRKVISDSTIDAIRLAGLLHDVGHGLMSHVVENALSGEETSEDILLQFKKWIGRSSKPQLSEMAAYFMVSSPAVADLLTSAFDMSPSRKAPDDVQSTIAHVIVGKKVSDELPVLHELISGPFDADKLDYMPRDARMCGVPVVTDVVRLIQKVRSVNVSDDKLPKEMTTVKRLSSGHAMFGVSRSGASALDEVSLNRSLMFDKVYRHQKVRAVESMVAACIQILHPVFTSSAALMPLKVVDDEFVELRLEDLKRRNADRRHPVSDEDLAIAGDIMSRLRDRHLFNRAFAFALTMPFDPYREDTDHEQKTEMFVRDLGDDPVKRREFVDEIVGYLDTIATLLDQRTQVDQIGLEKLHHYIRVDPPSSAGRGSEGDQSRAFLIDESGELLKVQKARAENSSAWANAYVNSKDVGFVFAPAELSDMVHIAAEVAARTLHDVRVPKQMHSYAKKNGSAVEAMRATLNEKGFYDPLPRDLAPVPELFSQVGAKNLIDRALENLHGYMGPAQRSDAPGSNTSTLNDVSVIQWAAQFPLEHQENALKVAAAIKMLDRELANAALSAFHDAHPEFENAVVVPMGESKDGSAILGYHQGDSLEALNYELMDVVRAIRSDRPIIFVDDIVGLGRSSSGIFTSYMGGDGGKATNEKREVRLDQSEIERLRNREHVALVWNTGFESGAKATVDVLAAYDVTAVSYIYEKAENLPTLSDALSDVADPEKEAFRRVLRDIGEQLLDGDPEASERALGYGNFELLITNSYNTPSLTLTALSKQGVVSGRAWQPLIPRRKKK